MVNNIFLLRYELKDKFFQTWKANANFFFKYIFFSIKRLGLKYFLIWFNFKFLNQLKNILTLKMSFFSFEVILRCFS